MDTSRLQAQLAMEEAISEHRPLCLINEDGTHSGWQPFVYG